MSQGERVKDTHMLEKALEYAERGFHVLPLRPMKKSPLNANGVKGATDNPKQIKRWWSENPSANIGIACGVGLRKPVAVDLDVGGANGVANWKTLAGLIGLDYKSCPRQKTPSGGYHLFWSNTSNKPWANSQSDIAAAIDTRAEGGYVVVAPSVSRKGRYQWEDGMSLLTVDLPDLPTAVSKMLTHPIPLEVAGGLDALLDEIHAAPRGTRNATLNRVAFQVGHLVHDGLPRDRAEDLLMRAANEAIPDEPRKSLRTIQSALDAGSETSSSASMGDLDQIGSVHDLSDLIKPKPREWLVQDVVECEKLTMLVGPPGSYKSLLAMDLAFAVASGSPWLPSGKNGFAVSIDGAEFKQLTPFKTKQADVLWIDLDQGSDEMARRMWALRKEYSTIKNTSFRYSNMPNLNLADGASLDWIVREVGSARLLVIDTFRRTFPWEMDENSSSVDQILKALRQVVRATNVSVLLLHHTNKGSRKAIQDNIRGSIAIAGGLDRAFLITKEEDAGDNAMRVDCVKARGPSVDKFAFCAQFSEGADGLVDIKFAQTTPEGEKNPSVIYAFLRKYLRGKGCTGPEAGPQVRTSDLMDVVMEHEGCGERKSRSLVKAAVREGFIHEQGATSAQRYWG